MDPIHFSLSADEPVIRQFLYYAIFQPAQQPPIPPEIVFQPDLRMYWENWGRRGDLACSAWINAHPVGAAWLRLWDNDTAKGYGYVADGIPELSTAVLPEQRNRGLGTRLLEKLFQNAKKEFAAISLSVQAENPALRLYERAGFARLRREGTSWIMLLRF